MGSLLWGLFVACALSVGLAAISDKSPDKKQISAFFQFAATSGGVFALIIAGSINYQQALYITGITAAISLAALFFLR